MGVYSLPICRAAHSQEHHGTGSWAWRCCAALSSWLPNVSVLYFLYTSTKGCLSFSYFQNVRLKVLQRGDQEGSHHLAGCELDVGEPVTFGRNSPVLKTTAKFSIIQAHHHHILLRFNGPVVQ